MEKLTLIGNADDDKMRMRTIRRKKRVANCKNCMAGLDDLLREGQVGSDEDVDVWREGVLCEFHGRLQSGRSNSAHSTRRHWRSKVLRFGTGPTWSWYRSPGSGPRSIAVSRLPRRRHRRRRHRWRMPTRPGRTSKMPARSWKRNAPRRYRNSGEERTSLRRGAFLDAGRAGDRFLDNLMAHATGIVRVFGFGSLAVLRLADDHVGPGAIRIFLSPFFQGDTLG
jgi:hypothetical protein